MNAINYLYASSSSKPSWLKRVCLVLALSVAWTFAFAPSGMAAVGAMPDVSTPTTSYILEHTSGLSVERKSKAPDLMPSGLTTFDYAAALKTRAEHSVLPIRNQDPNEIDSLLQGVAILTRPVSDVQIAAWKREIKSTHPKASRAAALHIWLGEVELVRNEQPERARWHFQRAQKLTHRGDYCYGLSIYDEAIATYYTGAYKEAVAAFTSLINPQTAIPGYDTRHALMWQRKAIACSSYHDARAVIGIPEPPRLDPLCGISALAASLRSLGRPYDKETILRSCRVTGEGSTLADLVAAGDKLKVHVYPLGVDKQGLLLLPKPLIAHVEHDHFVSIVATDATGVIYLCADCGGWPGGNVHVSWKQWQAMEMGVVAPVVAIGSPLDRILAKLPDHACAEEPAHLAFASGHKYNQQLRSLGLGLPILRGHAHRMNAPGFTYCVDRPTSQPCPPGVQCPKDGDPVNLATGEEEYPSGPDITVYNPHGPSVAWSRIYNSLRGGGSGYEHGDNTYQCNDFGVGWSQNYNVGVYAPAPYAGYVQYVYMPNGGRIAFEPMATPTAANPSVLCEQQQGGAAMTVTWNYDPNDPLGFYTIEFADRSQWITGNIVPGTYCYPLKQIRSGMGQSIYLNYTAAPNGTLWPLLSKITDQPNGSGTALLSIERTGDGTGTITSVTDCYGRSVYYNVTAYPDAYNAQELDHVSQIVPSCSTNPPDRYIYGYQLISSSGGPFKFFMLHSVSTPSPALVGMATTLINYDPTTNMISSLQDPEGNTRSYASVYVNGLLTSATKVTIWNNNNIAVYSYTASYNSNMCETSRTDGAGATISTGAYWLPGYRQDYGDPDDPLRPSDVFDGNSVDYHYDWDRYGNLLSVTPPSPRLATTYTYDYSRTPIGELVKVQEGNKTPTTLTYYDLASGYNGLLKTVSTPLPKTAVALSGPPTTTFTYDSLGNVLTISGPNSTDTGTSTTTFNYTTDGALTVAAAIGRPLTITDNAGKVTHMVYDSQFRMSSVTDANGHTANFGYNLADQPTLVTLPATGQTGTGRAFGAMNYVCPGGPATTMTLFNESGIQTRSVTTNYGLAGEVASVTGDTEPTAYTFDAFHRLKTLTDGNSQTTSYNYNLAGYLAGVSYPNANSSTGYDIDSYPSYDNAGNLLQSIDAKGVVRNYTYNDPEELLTDVTYPAFAAMNVHVAYDADYGRPSGVTDSTGSRSYLYDDQDNVTDVQTTYTGVPAKTVSYLYYPDGVQRSMSISGLTGSFQYVYDASDRLASVTNPYSQTTSWGYSDNNWLSTRQMANGVTTTYTPNAAGQLTSLVSRKADNTLLSQFTGITYDGAGNMTSMSASIPSAPAAYSGSTAYQYDGKDQLTQEISTRGGSYTNNFGYDSAGNPTSFKGVSFGYNIDNQLSAPASDGAGNPPSLNGSALAFDPSNHLTAYGSQMTAGYTSGGQRAWKQTAAGRTYYLYDGGAPVCEMDASGNYTAVNTFGADGLVSRAASATHTFYTFDPQGGAAQRLDTTGTPVASAMFDAYGTRASTDSSTDPYSGYGAQYGYYTDAETGLQLLGNRYYNPAAGRFVTRDPIDYAGGTNLYSYCRNNPVSGADPSGTSDFFTGMFVGYMHFCLEMGNPTGNKDYTRAVNIMFPSDPCDGFNYQAPFMVAALFTPGGLETDTVKAAEALEEADQVTNVVNNVAKGGGCFVAGTPIQMADGTSKAIDKVKSGETVATRDPSTGVTEHKRVVRTFTHTDHATVTACFADPKTGKVVSTVTATPEHPFYVVGKGFVGLSHLGIGTLIVTRAGPPLKVASLTRHSYPSGVAVYNLEVEDDHTYFVGVVDGGVWVHNNSVLFPNKGKQIGLGKTITENGNGESNTLEQFADDMSSPGNKVTTFNDWPSDGLSDMDLINKKMAEADVIYFNLNGVATRAAENNSILRRPTAEYELQQITSNENLFTKTFFTWW